MYTQGIPYIVPIGRVNLQCKATLKRFAGGKDRTEGRQRGLRRRCRILNGSHGPASHDQARRRRRGDNVRRRPGRRRQQQQRSLRSTDEPVHASAVSAGPDELDKSVCKNVRAVIVISYFVNSNTLVNGNLKSS